MALSHMLAESLQKSISKRKLISFREFLETVSPEEMFRNIFNVVPQMLWEYIGEGKQEYPNDPESIDYVDYDLSKIFEKNQTDPFYPDRLFANRFVNKFKYIDIGSKQNKLYVFRGPPGSGKSTFLNCFVSKLEEYINHGNGRMWEIVWKLGDDLIIPCPSHDNPLFLIPREDRKTIFNQLLKKNTKKKEVFENKEFEWIFNSKPCTFCSSIFQALVDESQKDIDCILYDHVFVRPYKVDRSIGEGSNIFNANDEIPKWKSQLLNIDTIQSRLDEYFELQGSKVRYDHSLYAKSNNGIYALMDLNDRNQERLRSLRGIVSEGKHKVNLVEERVNSLFLIVTNLEDEESIKDSALEDRKDVTKMNYILVPETQNKVFRKIYGENLENLFHPDIVDCFSKIIISTRMNHNTEIMKSWLKDLDKYNEICDDNFLLLKMEVYSGNIPSWLTDEDKHRFTADVRKEFLNEASEEGIEGISDRKAIELMNNLVQIYRDDESLISIRKLKTFCERIENETIAERVPKGFIDSMEKFYIFQVSEKIKDSIFMKNMERIKNDIKNYLYTLNHSIGETVVVPSTQETIKITEEFYEQIENHIFGRKNKDLRSLVFKKYISELSSELCTDEEMDQFKELYNNYLQGLKKNVLDKFISDEYSRNALKDYGHHNFLSYDKNIQRDVDNLVRNMVERHGYTEQSAKEVSLYIFDELRKG